MPVSDGGFLFLAAPSEIPWKHLCLFSLSLQSQEYTERSSPLGRVKIPPSHSLTAFRAPDTRVCISLMNLRSLYICFPSCSWRSVHYVEGGNARQLYNCLSSCTGSSFYRLIKFSFIDINLFIIARVSIDKTFSFTLHTSSCSHTQTNGKDTRDTYWQDTNLSSTVQRNPSDVRALTSFMKTMCVRLHENDIFTNHKNNCNQLRTFSFHCTNKSFFGLFFAGQY